LTPQPVTPEHTVSEIWHPRDAPRGWVGLEVIAVYKIVKAVGLVLTGLGVLGLLNPSRADAAQNWLEQLTLSEGHHLAAALAGRALQLLETATPKRLVVAALGSFLYAAIFIVEGVGLWRCKRWAEYLTVIVTASLLPLELVAVIRHATPLRLGAVISNVAVVIYLVWQLYATRETHALRAAARARN
jgi:uncharacterized membrane protein (DUF2068 family)